MAALLGCENKREVIEGKEVEQVKTRWGLLWGTPIPGRVSQMYYVYTDKQGNKVKHGPYKSFDGDGRLNFEAFYRDGKLDGTATSRNSAGQKTQEKFTRMGEDIGWANYTNGRLDYELQHIFEGDRWVATKKYDYNCYRNGSRSPICETRWTLGFSCGNRIDKDINPRTGQMIDLAPPFAISCQH